ncbi:ABC transporter substrate-binding protein [Rhizobium leguminosarum]|uniref:ABC transporter substrate-binding protein n=1 Tax=Rhizobium leguminosarum TaxID=384 RepID=UPI002FF17271
MRFKLLAATAAVAVLASGSAFAQSANLTIWSWNVAASALKSTLPGFNKQFPDIKITVEDLGKQPGLRQDARCLRCRGDGLPDIVSIENFEAEIFWSRFPDCFANLKELGYTADIQAKFPDFKRTELEVGDVAYAMPWDSGPVAVFYRRDLYEKAGVDPSTISTWDDFIAAGKKDFRRQSRRRHGAGRLQRRQRMVSHDRQRTGLRLLFDRRSEHHHQPAGLRRLAAKGEGDEGCRDADVGQLGRKIQANTAGKAASQLYGGWYEGTVRSTSPDLKGKWGVYRMPSLTADGPHAANLGGSSLAISATSANKEAAWKFVNYALGTDEGQITMLKEFGLVPSLLSAEKDPFVNEPQPYWGGQKVWADILATLPKIVPSRGTAFQSDAEAIFKATQTKFFAGGYPDAKAALDDAAKQIASATGLPIAQ